MAEFDDDLISLFVGKGVGVFNTTLFAGSKAVVPQGDGPYLSITLTGGTSPEHTQNSTTKPAYQRPSAQLVARALSPSAAKAMARAAYDAVVSVRNMTVNGTYYREMMAIQEPFDMGLDVASRQCYTFNVRSVRRPT
jgi:hypothetical protein